MKTVKVTVKREQIEPQLTVSKVYTGMGEIKLTSLPDEIALELPVEQAELRKEKPEQDGCPCGTWYGNPSPDCPVHGPKRRKRYKLRYMVPSQYVGHDNEEVVEEVELEEIE